MVRCAIGDGSLRCVAGGRGTSRMTQVMPDKEIILRMQPPADKIVVTFNEHVSADEVTSITSSIAAYGNVLRGGSDRQLVVEVFRLSKAPGLRAQLAQWALHGF